MLGTSTPTRPAGIGSKTARRVVVAEVGTASTLKAVRWRLHTTD
jgi:hypothetical protein